MLVGTAIIHEPPPARLFVTVDGVWFVLDSVECCILNWLWVTTLDVLEPAPVRLFVTVDGVMVSVLVSV